MSQSSGFSVRKSRKITAYHFVMGFLLSVSRCQSSFRGWALQISQLSGHVVSKQGVFDRVHVGAANFAQKLLEWALLQQSIRCFNSTLFGGFKRVLMQDSTTLKLPQRLSGIFAGNYSRGKQRAVARIQSIMNIKAMHFISFTLGAFTQNDQSASSSILSIVRKGDLVIRDLGYAVLLVFEQLINKEVHFLSRLKYGISIYDEKGDRIVLKTLLRERKIIDRWVYIGSNSRLKVRLVMLPLSAVQSAERVRKARLDRDRRINHSRQYYQWLGYKVYITTVDEATWEAKEVHKAYRVRWQMEIMFKSWKSGFGLQDMLPERSGNEHRVKVSIYLMLLYISLVVHHLYVPYRHQIEHKGCRRISLLKLTEYAARNIQELFTLSPGKLEILIIQHCCYDKRTNRTNMTDLYQNFKN